MEFILANDYRCMIILCSRLDDKFLKILRLIFDVETFIEDLAIQIQMSNVLDYYYICPFL